MLTKRKENYLKKFYFNPQNEGSLSGVSKFYKGVLKAGRKDISRSDIKEFLKSENVYTTNKFFVRKFKSDAL